MCVCVCVCVCVGGGGVGGENLLIFVTIKSPHLAVCESPIILVISCLSVLYYGARILMSRITDLPMML